MGGDKFDQLYNALKADGAVSGTRENFKKFVYAPGKQGYQNRLQLYNALHADGAVSSKSYEEFAQKIGLHAVNNTKQPTAQPRSKAAQQAVAYKAPQVPENFGTLDTTTAGQSWLQRQNSESKPVNRINVAKDTPVDVTSRVTGKQGKAPRVVKHNKNEFFTQTQLGDSDLALDYGFEGRTQKVEDDKKRAAALLLDQLTKSDFDGIDKLYAQKSGKLFEKSMISGITTDPNDAMGTMLGSMREASQKYGTDAIIAAYNKAIPSIFSNDSSRKAILEQSKKLGMDPDVFVQQYMLPNIEKSIHDRLVKQHMPKSDMDYVMRGVLNGVGGNLFTRGVMTKTGRDIMNEGHEKYLSNIEERIKDDGVFSKAGVAKYGNTTMGMASDIAAFAGAGKIAGGMMSGLGTGVSLLTNTPLGKRLIGGAITSTSKLVEKYGVEGAARIASFVGNNKTWLGTILTDGAKGTLRSGLTLGNYGAMQYVTGEGYDKAESGDTDNWIGGLFNSYSDEFKTGLKFGVVGAVGSTIGRNVGITGAETSNLQRIKNGIKKASVSTGAFVAESLAFRSDQIAEEWAKDHKINFMDNFIQGACENMAMKLGSGHYKQFSPKNILRSMTMAAGDKSLKLTDTEKRIFLENTDARNLVEACEALEPNHKTQGEGLASENTSGMKYKDRVAVVNKKQRDLSARDAQGNAVGKLQQFLDNKEIPLKLRMKVSAALGGTMGTKIPRASRIVIEQGANGKNIVKEYAEDGELIDAKEHSTYGGAEEDRQERYLRRQDRDFKDEYLNAMDVTTQEDMMSVMELVAKDNGFDSIQDMIHESALRNSQGDDSLDKKIKADYKKRGEEYAGTKAKRVLDIQRAVSEEYKVDLDKAMDKDFMLRTDEENEAIDEFKRRLRGMNTDKNDEAQNKAVAHQDGADLSEQTELEDSEKFTENAKTVNDRQASATAAWMEMVKNTPELEEWMKNNPDATVEEMRDNFGDDVADAYMELSKAKSMKDGFIQNTSQKIEDAVQNQVAQARFTGTMQNKQGAKVATDNTVTIFSDKDGNEYTLVGGDVIVDTAGDGSYSVGKSGLVIFRDKDGNTVQRTNFDGLTEVGTLSAEDYANRVRTTLQERKTAEIQSSETPLPEVQKEEPKGEKKPDEPNGEGESSHKEEDEPYKIGDEVELRDVLFDGEDTDKTRKYKIVGYDKDTKRWKMVGPDGIETLSAETSYLDDNIVKPNKNVPHGRKIITHHLDMLDKAESPEEKLNAISAIRNNVKNGGIITTEEQAKVNKIEQELKEQGYEIVDLTGKEYNGGEKVEISQSISVEPGDPLYDKLEDGQTIIKSVRKPQIMKDGKLYRSAEVITATREDTSVSTVLYDDKLVLGGIQKIKNPSETVLKRIDDLKAEISELEKKKAEELKKTDNNNETEEEIPKFKDGTEVPMTEDSKGRPTADYGEMTPAHAAEYISTTFGDNADKVVDGKIKRAEAAVKAANKIKVDYSADDADILEAEGKKKAAVEAAEKDLTFYTKVKAEMNKKAAYDNAGGGGQTGNRYEQWRKDGYHIGEGGVRYDRQKEEDQTGVYGREATVDFAPGVSVKGRFKAVEVGSVQASHKNGQVNPLHFGLDWQPKDRTDEASTVAQDKALKTFDPLKITGDGNAFIFSSPSLNKRYETIQGNNRIEILRRLYAEYPEKAALYKQWLIDHAAEFGLDAAEISKMDKPILVIELPVDDAKAKELGQYKASDFESSGKEIPQTGAVVNKLGDKMETVASILMRQGELGEDAKLSDLINQNADKVLDFLSMNGIISETEVQTLRKDRTQLRIWLGDLLKQGLFDGDKQTEAAFSQIPDNAKKAVLATYLRDVKSPEGAKIKANLQRSFDAYARLMGIPAFANAKNLNEARAAVNAEIEKGNTSLFGEAPLREEFSTFELELAAMYKGLKDQKTLAGLFNKYFDAVQGDKATNRQLELGEEPREAISKEDAIKEVFGSYDTKPAETQEQVDKAKKEIATELTKQLGEDLVTTDEKTGQEVIDNAEADGTTLKYSKREKPAPKKTQKVYKLMRLGDDGKLYPLFIDATAPTELGVWYDADSPDLSMLKDLPSGVHLVNPKTKKTMTYEQFYNEHPELFKGKMSKYPSKEAIKWATQNGMRFMYIEDTKKAQKRFEGEHRKYWNLGVNGSGTVSTFSMRPGWHAGSLPTMRQIGKGENKDLRDDRFVWVEGEVSADKDYSSEAESNPDHDLPDRIPEDGYYMKATNADKTKSQADRVGWYVAGSFKANRIIGDKEAHKVIDDWNVAHPDKKVEYDYERESGKEFNADTMQLEGEGKDRKEFRTKDGEVYGFVKDGKIYLDTKKMKPETPLHEYTHLWTEALKSKNPKEWENVKKLLDEVDGLKEEVQKLYPELKGDDLYDEMLATYSGREGTKKLEAEARRLAAEEGKTVTESAKAQGFVEKVKTALQKYWKGVADMLHIHFTNAEEVADKVLADWAKGVKPGEEKGVVKLEDPSNAEEGLRANAEAYKKEEAKGEQPPTDTGTKKWEDMTPEEKGKEADEHPLTEEEIRNGASEENQELVAAAIAYVNGDKSLLNQIAYLKIYGDVRNRHENVPGNSGTEDGTQLAATDNGSGDGLELESGRGSGGAAEPVDKGAGGETASGEPNGGENGEGGANPPAGKQGDSQGEGGTPGLGGLSAGSTKPEGSGTTGGKGSVGRGGRRGGSGGPSKSDAKRKPTAKQGTIFPDSKGKDVKKETSDAKAAMKAAFAKFKELNKKDKGKLSSSLLFGLENKIPTAEALEYLPEVMKATGRYGIAVMREGIYKAKEWFDSVREAISDDMKDCGFSDEDVDAFIREMWHMPWTMDGETHKIGEWSSIYGYSTLRSKLKEPLKKKFDAQVLAEPTEVKVGDKKNIEETLPFLLPQQQEDVLRAETQFFDESHKDKAHAGGKGYMFTNGTETGKTYTGLGIVKRMVKQGKKRILIITPSQAKVTDWKNDGKNLCLDIRDLDDWAKEHGTTATTEKGEGVVITTFANFRANKSLLEDQFDMVVYDESHRIMENKKGIDTEGSRQHYMLTNRNEDYALMRLEETNEDWQKLKGLAGDFDNARKKKINEIEEQYRKENPSATDRDVRNATQKLYPKDMNSFSVAEKQKFPELGKIYDDYIATISHYETDVKPGLVEQAKKSVDATKVVFLSATPFNSRENIEYAEGYLFSYPERNAMGQSGKMQRWREKMGETYDKYSQMEKTEQNGDKQAVFGELKELACKLAGMTEDEMRRYLTSKNSKGYDDGGVRFRMELGKTFSDSKEDFDGVRDRAVEEKGIVMPNLNKESVKVVSVEKHRFGEDVGKMLDNAEEWAKSNLVTTDKSNLPTMRDGTPYTISKNAIDKYLSSSATKKSDNLGVHLSVLPNLKDVIHESIETEIHPDYNKGEDGNRSIGNGYGNNVLVHRLYGAVKLDGKIYRVKTTMQEFRGGEENKPHSYEVTRIELLEGSEAAKESDSLHVSRTTNNSISAAKLLNGVGKSYDKGKKLLDESKDLADGETRFRKDESENATSGELTPREREQQEQMEKHRATVLKTTEKLNTRTTIHDSLEDIENETVRKAIENGEKVKAWYDMKTGEVHLYLPNVTDKYDAQKSIVHEVVGHKGMRNLLGESGYRDMMRRMYTHLSAEEAAEVNERMMKNGWDFYTAMDEWVADKAEESVWTPQEYPKYIGLSNLWSHIKHYVTEAIHKAGYNINPNVDDVKYWLWESKRALQNGDTYTEMKRNSFLWRLNHGTGKETLDDVINSPAYNHGDAQESVRYRKETSDDAMIEEAKTLFRKGSLDYSKNDTPQETATKDAIEQRLGSWQYRETEAWKDNMASLDTTQKEMSKSIKNFDSSMDVYHGAINQSSVVAEKRANFERRELKDLQQALRKPTKALGGGERGYENVNMYIYMKSGLERNRVLLVRDVANNIDTRIKKFNAELRENDPKANVITFTGIEQYRDEFHAEKDYLTTLLEQGQIDLHQYYDKLDKFIRDFEFTKTGDKAVDAKIDKLNKWYKDSVADKYDPNGNDYSGISSIVQYRVNGQFSDSAIIDAVMQAENTIGIDDVENLWSAVRGVTGYALESDHKYGIVSSAAKDRAKGMFNWYIPMRGFKEDSMEDSYAYMHSDSNKLASSSLKTAKGRTTLAQSPLGTAAAMAERAISRGEDNANKQRMYRLANAWLKEHTEEDGNGGMRLTEVPPVMVSDVWYEKKYDSLGNEYWEVATPDIKPDMSAEAIRKEITDFENDMKAKQAKGGATKTLQKGGYAKPFEDPMHKKQNIVTVWFGGKQRQIIFTGNPRAAQALNGELKSDEHGNRLMRFMGSMFTSYNVTFSVSNLSRDTLFANNNISIKENAEYYARFTAMQARLLGGQTIGMLTANVHEKVRGEYFNMWAHYKQGKAPKGDLEKLFYEFMDNGGKTGFVKTKTIDNFEDEIRKNAGGRKAMETVGKVLHSLPEVIEGLNERAENLNRFACYATSRKMGRSIMRSITDAKEVSVNFNRRGLGAKAFDVPGATWIEKAFVANAARWCRGSYMFFNAGMQGLRTLQKNMVKHPIKTTINMIGIPMVLGGYLIPLLNQVLAGDDGEKYASLPEWERRNNFCFYLGKDKWLKIPLAIELRAFYGLGDVARSVEDKRLQSANNIWLDAAAQLTQILPVDFMGEGMSPVNAAVPDYAKPVWQVANNEDWTGKPIYKDYDYMKYDPEYLKVYAGEFEPFVNLSKFINKASGGTAVTKGDWDGKWNNPAIWNNIVQGYFGGAGSDATRTAKIVKRLVTGDWDGFSTREVPMVRAMYSTPTEKTVYYRGLSKYAKYKELSDKYDHDMRVWKKNQDNPEISMKYNAELHGNSLDKRINALIKENEKVFKKCRKIINSGELSDDEAKAMQMQMDKAKLDLVNEIDNMK